MSLILKQEGQRWLHSFYKKKKRRRKKYEIWETPVRHKIWPKSIFPPTFRLASVFEQVFVGDGEVASL